MVPDGLGTALKPAWEPIVVARKPLTGTVAANVLAHGTGALNVDGCRIGTDGGGTTCTNRGPDGRCLGHRNGGRSTSGETFHGPDSDGGRWPANVVLDPEAAAMLDEQTGEMRDGTAVRRNVGGQPNGNTVYGEMNQPTGDDFGYGGSGGASRLFYVAKASSAERNAGLDGFEAVERVDLGGGRRRCLTCGAWEWRPQQPDLRRCECGTATEWENVTTKAEHRNVHPTVKPIDLMRWLVRLVTPPEGTVLDPFTGSGTTGIAASLEGFRFIGIEREAEYAAIARARIAWWAQHPDGMELVQRLEHEKQRKAAADAGQLGLFE